MMDRKREISIGEFDQSIIELQKRKFRLLKEVEQINLQISFLRQQQEQLINVRDERDQIGIGSDHRTVGRCDQCVSHCSRE